MGVRQLAINIVLYEPEIPANTGNIARTCAATNAALHLIHPLGFSIDDKAVKRAGLDYWPKVNIYEYDSFEQFYEQNKKGQLYYIEDYGSKIYSNADFSDAEIDYFLIFGKETAGIPEEILKQNKEACLTIPMTDNVRSLNLSNAVAIVAYEALRQQLFKQIY